MNHVNYFFAIRNVLGIAIIVITLCINSQTALSQSNIGFTQNEGQLLNTNDSSASDVLFYSHSNEERFYLMGDRVSYVFSRQYVEDEEDSSYVGADTVNVVMDSVYRMDLVFKDVDTSVSLTGADTLELWNFLLHHLDSNGLSDVATYDSIKYSGLQEYTDLICRNRNGLSYSFLFDATGHGDALHIVELSMEIEGGTLSVDTARRTFSGTCDAGSISFSNIYALQGTDEIDTLSFSISKEDNIVTISISDYDHYQDIRLLLFDKEPASSTQVGLSWSTFIAGGSTKDVSKDVKIDEDENIYVCGATSNILFPRFGGEWLNYEGDFDAFLMKFQDDYRWDRATLYGGAGRDYANKIEINSTGDVYLLGYSSSFKLAANLRPEIIGNNSYDIVDQPQGGNEIFLIRFNDQLRCNASVTNTFATPFGGAGEENAYAMVIDEDDNVFIGGFIRSDSYNTFRDQSLSGAYYQKASSGAGPTDAFIAMIDDDNELIWCSAFGGDNVNAATGTSAGFGEAVTGLAVDSDGKLCAMGVTHSNYWEESSPVTVPKADYFIITKNGGGAYEEQNFGKHDGFVMKFDVDYAISWSTLIGGQLNDVFPNPWANGEGTGIAFDENDNLFIGGYKEYNSSWPSEDPSQYSYQSSDGEGFICKFDTDNVLVWSTEFEGEIYDLEINDLFDLLLVSGTTDDMDLPVLDDENLYFDDDLGGASDGFVAGFYTTSAIQWWTTYFGGEYISDDFDAVHGISTEDSRIVIGGYSTTRNGASFPLHRSNPAFYPLAMYNPIYHSGNIFPISVPFSGNAFIAEFTYVCAPCERVMQENSESNTSELMVFPNPSDNYIFLRCDSKEQIQSVTIYDLVGRKLLFVEEHNVDKVDISKLSDGVYIVKVFTSIGNQYTDRVIVKN